MADPPSSFTVMVTGQIDNAEIPHADNAYCKFRLVRGSDWSLIEGFEDGITQVTRQVGGVDAGLVWNFPLDVTYKSTNAFGWPQLVLSVYGLDSFGRDVVQGYGCAHLPTCPGRHTLKVRLFRPLSSSGLKQFIGWLTGMPAEFADPEFAAKGEGREVTRVSSGGYVLVRLNVLMKDAEAFGYETGTVRPEA